MFQLKLLLDMFSLTWKLFTPIRELIFLLHSLLVPSSHVTFFLRLFGIILKLNLPEPI